MDDRAADLALLSVAMPKPATTDTIAAGSSVAVFFIGGHFLYICRVASLPPCRTEVGAGLDRRFARVAAFGPLLSQKAVVPHGPGVPASDGTSVPASHGKGLGRYPEHKKPREAGARKKRAGCCRS